MSQQYLLFRRPVRSNSSLRTCSLRRAPSIASPAKAATTFFSGSITTLTMYASLAFLTASIMSAWIGLPYSTPMRAFSLAIKVLQWFPRTVLATDARQDASAPAGKAREEKCGSMNPSASGGFGSAAARRLMTNSAPDGSFPKFTISSLSQLWITIFSFCRISSPSFSRSSRTSVSRWHPVATSKVISISGLFLLAAPAA